MSLNLYSELYLCLAYSAEVLDIVERCDKADTASADNGLTKPHLVHTVVDKHFYVSHLNYLVPEIWQDRESQVSVGDSRLVWAFFSCTFCVDVYPLMVECGVGKQVYAFLVESEPL